MERFMYFTNYLNLPNPVSSAPLASQPKFYFDQDLQRADQISQPPAVNIEFSGTLKRQPKSPEFKDLASNKYIHLVNEYCKKAGLPLLFKETIPKRNQLTADKLMAYMIYEMKIAPESKNGDAAKNDKISIDELQQITPKEFVSFTKERGWNYSELLGKTILDKPGTVSSTPVILKTLWPNIQNTWRKNNKAAIRQFVDIMITDLENSHAYDLEQSHDDKALLRYKPDGALGADEAAPIAYSKKGNRPAIILPFIKDTTVQNFYEDVIQASRHRLVLVDFSALWCGPCRLLTPVLEKIVLHADGELRLVKVNSDEYPGILKQLADNYPNILNEKLKIDAERPPIPIVAAFKDGKLIDAFTGWRHESRIQQFISDVSAKKQDAK
jgi:thiol-disulfide isomerase/thioredoxin